jgi:replicative DNA helicase
MNDPEFASRGDKPLPCSEDAEKGLVCSLIRAPGKVSALCASRLRHEAFNLPAHRIIYDAILEWNKPVEQVDFVWLCNTVNGQIEEVGGFSRFKVSRFDGY